MAGDNSGFKHPLDSANNFSEDHPLEQPEFTGVHPLDPVPASKGELLDTASLEKQEQLEWKTVMLTDSQFSDADTFYDDQQTGYRFSSDTQGRSYDAYEAKIENYQRQLNDPAQRDAAVKKLTRQRTALAREMGVSVDRVSLQDVVARGQQSRNAMLEAAKLGQVLNEQGQFQLQYRETGEDQLGRRLVEVRNPVTGEVLNKTFNTPEHNADFYSYYNQLGKDEYIQRWAARRQNPETFATVAMDTASVLAAGAVGVGQSVGNAALMAAEGYEQIGTALFSDNWATSTPKVAEWRDTWNEAAGTLADALLTENAKEKQAQLYQQFVENFDNEEFLAKLPDAVLENPAGVFYTFVQSVPFMAAMASRAAASLPTGMGLMVDSYKQGEELYKQKYGEDPDAAAKAMILAAGAGIAVLNGMGARFIANKPVFSSLSKADVPSMTKYLAGVGSQMGLKAENVAIKRVAGISLQVMGQVARPIEYGAKGVIVEGVQEGLEPALIASAVQAGAGENPLDYDDDTQQEIAVNAAIGGLSGGQGRFVMPAAAAVGDVSVTKAKETIDRVKNPVSKIRQNEILQGSMARFEKAYETFQRANETAQQNIGGDAQTASDVASTQEQIEEFEQAATDAAEEVLREYSQLPNRRNASKEFKRKVFQAQKAIRDTTARRHQETDRQVQTVLAENGPVNVAIDIVLGSEPGAVSPGTIQEVIARTEDTQQQAQLLEHQAAAEIHRVLIGLETGLGSNNQKTPFVGLEDHIAILKNLQANNDTDGIKKQRNVIKRFVTNQKAKASVFQSIRKRFDNLIASGIASEDAIDEVFNELKGNAIAVNINRGSTLEQVDLKTEKGQKRFKQLKDANTFVWETRNRQSVIAALRMGELVDIEVDTFTELLVDGVLSADTTTETIRQRAAQRKIDAQQSLKEATNEQNRTGQGVEGTAQTGVPQEESSGQGFEGRGSASNQQPPWEQETEGSSETINVYAGTNENVVLSNLSTRVFKFGDRSYNSVEHAYQSLKSGEFDIETWRAYRQKGHARKIPGKKGTKVKDDYNLKLMKELILESFKQNPEAANKLLSTGNATITHTQDKGIWREAFPRILMEVREELRGENKVTGVTAQILHQVQKTIPQQLRDYIKDISLLDFADPESKSLGRFESESQNIYLHSSLNNLHPRYIAGVIWHEIGHALDYMMGERLGETLMNSSELDKATAAMNDPENPLHKYFNFLGKTSQYEFWQLPGEVFAQIHALSKTQPSLVAKEFPNTLKVIEDAYAELRSEKPADTPASPEGPAAPEVTVEPEKSKVYERKGEGYEVNQDTIKNGVPFREVYDRLVAIKEGIKGFVFQTGTTSNGAVDVSHSFNNVFTVNQHKGMLLSKETDQYESAYGLITSIREHFGLDSLMDKVVHNADLFTFKGRTGQRYKNTKLLAEDWALQLLHPTNPARKGIMSVMSIASLQWIANFGKDTAYNDDEVVRAFLQRSNGEDQDLSFTETDLLRNIGSSRDRVAEEMGRMATTMLGITQKSDSKEQFPEALSKLQRDLGHKMIHALIEAGVLEEHRTSIAKLGKLIDPRATIDKDSELVTVRIKTKTKKSFEVAEELNPVLADLALKPVRDAFNAMTGFEFDQEPEGSAIEKVNRNIKNSFYTMSDGIAAFIKSLQAQQWVQSQSGDVLLRMTDKQLGNMPVHGISGSARVIDDPDTTINVNRRDAVKGRNQNIQRSIEKMREGLQGSSLQQFYFKWQTWSNARFGINSTGLNPQSNKLHRHAMVLAKNIRTIKAGNNEAFRAWRTGIALAFGAKDYWSEKQAKEHYDKILKNPNVKEAIKLINEEREFSDAEAEVINRVMDLGGEGFYTFDALVSLAQRAKSPRSFETTFTVETDGITNGAILGMLQSGLGENVYEWLNRGGIFFASDKHKNNASVRESMDDAYQTLARNVFQPFADVRGKTKKVSTARVQEFFPGLDPRTPFERENKKEISKKEFQQRSQRAINALEYLIGNRPWIDENGNVTSEGRNFMKDPLMVFFYGAGMPAIRRNFLANVENTWWNRSEKGKKEFKELVKQMNALLAIYAPDAQIDPDQDPLEFSLSAAQKAALHEAIDSTVGQKLADTMSSEFQGMIEFKNTQLDIVNTQFSIFQYMFNKRMTEYRDKHGLKEDELIPREVYTNILNDLEVYIPRVKNPTDADSAIQGIKENLIKRYDRAASTLKKGDKVKIYNVRTSAKTSSYQSVDGKVEQKITYSHQPEYGEANVATLVKGIHQLDSTVIRAVVEDFNALILHDAALYAADETVEGTKRFNQAVFEHSRDFFMAADLMENLQGMIDKINTDFPNPEDILHEINVAHTRRLVSQYNNTKFPNAIWLAKTIAKRNKGKNNGKQWGEEFHFPFTIYPTLGERVEALRDVVNRVQDHRNELLGHIEGVQQGAFPMDEVIFQPEDPSQTRPAPIHSISLDQESLIPPKVVLRLYRDLVGWDEETESSKRFKEMEAWLTKEGPEPDWLGSDAEADLGGFDGATRYTASPNTVRELMAQIVHAQPGRENSSHQSYLVDLVDRVVAASLDGLEGFPIDIVSWSGRNVGRVDSESLKVKLGNDRPTGVAMSGAETYAHELIHLITAKGYQTDPDFRRRIDQIFKEARKLALNGEINVRDFLSRDPHDPDKILLQADPKAELKAAQERFDYIFLNKEGKGAYEFIAFALTNQALMKKLGTIPSPQKIESKPEENMLQSWYRQFMEAMLELAAKMRALITGEEPPNDDIYSELVDLVKDLHGLNSKAEIISQSTKDALHSNISTILRTTNHYASAAGRKLGFRANPNRGPKGAMEALRNHKLLVKLQPAMESAWGEGIRKRFFKKDGFFYNLFNQEILGGTQEYQQMQEALRKSKRYIDGRREEATHHMLSIVHKLFPDGSDYSEEKKTILSKVLVDLDISYLGGVDVHELDRLIGDLNHLNQEISKFEAGIIGDPQFAPYQAYILDQLEGLGAYKATGSIFSENGQFDSATAIMQEVSNTLFQAGLNSQLPEDTQQKWQRLITLYGIRHLDQQIKDDFQEIHSEMNAHDKTAMSTLISAYAQLRNEMDEATPFDPTIAHGFTREVYDNSVERKIASVSQKAEMKKQGYELVYTFPFRESDVEHTQGLYVSNLDKQQDYFRGVASLTKHRPSRFNLVDIYKENTAYNVDTLTYYSETAAKVEKLRNRLERFQQKSILKKNRQFNTRRPKGSLLMNGRDIYLAIPEQIKKEHLGLDTSIDRVLARLQGYVVDLEGTQRVNTELFTSLADAAIEQASSHDLDRETMEEIYPEDDWLNMETEMPEHFQRLKTTLKQNAAEHPSVAAFLKAPYIRRDVGRIAFGYKKFSVDEVKWLQENAGPVLKLSIKITETLWQDFAKYGAVQIVIKTPQVLFDNIVSNISQLVAKGLSIPEVWKYFKEAHQELDTYQRLRTDELELQAKLALLPTDTTKREKKRLEADLATTREALARNKVKPLIDAGVYQSITEDIDSSEQASSILSNLRAVKFLNEKSPASVKWLFNNLIMTKQSFPFQVFQHLTQESDFWARYAEYQFNLEQDPDQDKNELVNEIMQNYVHYDVPIHRGVQYANDMGIFRFTKYFLRTQRVLASRFRDNPSRVAGLQAMQYMFGDVADIYDSALIGDSLEYRWENMWDTLVRVPGDVVDIKGWELIETITPL